MKKLPVIAIAVFVISGCVEMAWAKPGGTQDEFGKDNYASLQEAQQRVSKSYRIEVWEFRPMRL